MYQFIMKERIKNRYIYFLKQMRSYGVHMLFIWPSLFQSCDELVNCLRQQDFTDFATQLEGLASIYQLNAEKAVKCNALSALQSLEADLTTLSSLQSYDAQAMLCKSPVGILLKRRGGKSSSNFFIPRKEKLF